ncbi:MAG: hypothetical protein ACRCYU_03040 [Nocardioides sp.]
MDAVHDWSTDASVGWAGPGTELVVPVGIGDCMQSVLEFLASERLGEPVNNDEVLLRSDDLHALWVLLVGEDSFASRQGMRAFLEVACTDTADEPGFAFRPGGWEVRLSGAAVQATISAALLAGILAVVGADQLPAVVVATVVPLLVNVDRVRLTKRDEELLKDLTVGPAAQGAALSIDELFALLPEGAQKEVGRLQFFEFIDTCRKAGLVDVDSADKVRVRPDGFEKFRVTVS